MLKTIIIGTVAAACGLTVGENTKNPILGGIIAFSVYCLLSAAIDALE